MRAEARQATHRGLLWVNRPRVVQHVEEVTERLLRREYRSVTSFHVSLAVVAVAEIFRWPAIRRVTLARAPPPHTPCPAW